MERKPYIVLGQARSDRRELQIVSKQFATLGEALDDRSRHGLYYRTVVAKIIVEDKLF